MLAFRMIVALTNKTFTCMVICGNLWTRSLIIIFCPELSQLPGNWKFAEHYYNHRRFCCWCTI